MPTLKLRIKLIRIFIEGGELRDVNIEGREDIFDHPDVRHFLKNREGRIIYISGDFEFRGISFYFQAGYIMGEGLGRISVRKKGRRTGNLAIRNEAFDFLYEIYKEYFIEIS